GSCDHENLKPERDDIPYQDGHKEIKQRGHNAFAEKLPGVLHFSIGCIRESVLENVLRITREQLIEARIEFGEEVTCAPRQDLRDRLEICPARRAELPIIRVVSSTRGAEHKATSSFTQARWSPQHFSRVVRCTLPARYSARCRAEAYRCGLELSRSARGSS